MTLQEAIALLEANGWAVVPRRPTQVMLQDGWYGAHGSKADEVWADMIEAAPIDAQIQGQRVVFARAGGKSESGS